MVEKSVAEKDNDIGIKISIAKNKSHKDLGLSKIDIHILKLICDKKLTTKL